MNDKKTNKKIKKFRSRAVSGIIRYHSVCSRDEILSDIPTCTIWVCSCSNMTGVSPSMLAVIFEEYDGEVYGNKDIPYSVVTFGEVEDAMRAYDALNNSFNCSINRYLLLEYSLNQLDVDHKKISIPGLHVIPDFISEAEESDINLFMESNEWERLSMRDVQHYGFEYDYQINSVDPKSKIGQLPPFCDYIIPRIMDTGYVEHAPNQITVNKYEPGSGIPEHVDTHSIFQDGIISLSLLSDIIIDMRHPDGTHIPVYVPKRALFIMTGESRYLWSHAIASRKYDFVNNERLKRETRISLSFRSIRVEGPCNCPYKVTWQCDTWLSRNNCTRREQKYVHEPYEELSLTYQYKDLVFDKIKEYVDDLAYGDIICDVGCGIGNYHSTKAIIESIDYCHGFLRQNENDAVHCKSMSIPYPANIFDGIICVNLLQNLSTEGHRISSIDEMIRVCKRGGIIQLVVPQMSSNYKFQDILIPSDINPQIQIFNHLFTDDELDPILLSNDMVVIFKSIKDLYIHYTLTKK